MHLLETFGKIPSGAALEKIKQSPNFRNNIFQNLHPTVMMAEGTSMAKALWQFMNKPKNAAPPHVLPAIKNDVCNIRSTKPVITWFGHSSYFIHINGKNILVDPVLSGNASPFTFTTKSFAGTDVYAVEDLPEIDVLLLTHDHYDHLDHRTVKKLKHKTRLVCTSLGVAPHLRYWGYGGNNILEFDWHDSRQVADGITLTAAPARHFSGRGFVRNRSLWSSFILKAPGYNLYLGGDSGYDTHFKPIGQEHGPFDIALLECGQYNTAWPQIHMMPEETVHAAIDLHAKWLMPVHWGKFSLSLHAWDEPVKRVTAEAAALRMPITTPIIGEQVILGEFYPVARWWER
jgi:L-ascorbate metabolism protein UlaG (beta-lactamase superfamily)